MAVAGEAEVEPEGGQIVVLRKEVERARETQAQLVAIERHALDLLEHLRQVDR